MADWRVGGQMAGNEAGASGTRERGGGAPSVSLTSEKAPSATLLEEEVMPEAPEAALCGRCRSGLPLAPGVPCVCAVNPAAQRAIVGII